MARQTDFYLVCYSEKEIYGVVDDMKNPVMQLEIINRTSFGIIKYGNCFIANESVGWLRTRMGWSPANALFFMRLLHTKQIIRNCVDKDAKFENDVSFWRFQSDEKGPLNWKFIWTAHAEGDPCVIVEGLLAKLLEMVRLVAPKKFLSQQETLACLEKVSTIKNFKKFQKEISVLQKIKCDFSSENKKKAFWINVYNMLATHSLITKAIAHVNPFATYYTRKDFFANMLYIIGGENFSLDDIETGILRKVDYFKENDPRSSLQLQRRDFRIHCCLGCLTKSSPSPIIIWHEWTDWYIELATKGFFNTITIDDKTGKVILPKLVYRYIDDFNITKENIQAILTPYLNFNQKGKLNSALKSKLFQIEYSDDSWDLTLDTNIFSLLDIGA